MKAAAPHLVPLVEAVHAQLLPGKAPRVHVEFYPYVSTKSTIRERNGALHLRISDHLLEAPDEVLCGVFGILLARLRRVPEQRVDPDHHAAYHAYLDGAATKRRTSRRSRGRKHLDPIGTHRSLLESYLRVVMAMDLDVPAPRLSWSQRVSRRRFGHHDADHDCIVISRVLDDDKVPEYVLDFVMYHELLHIAIPPTRGSGSRRIVHSKAFRAAEAKFPQRAEAERWLTRLASR